MTTENSELLRRYVADRSESAFATLVERHLGLVYSAALRQVSGDAPAAQDVTQAVFCDLARQAPRLLRHPSLTAWLYTSTRYLAAKTRRAEQRRRAREQQAHAMNRLLQTENPDPAWQELRPVLDDAMHGLSAADREAVLLRYFENRPLAEIGARLGLTENAARMRLERALDKLRALLAKRGVTSTAAALAASLAQHAVGAAPAGLAGQVTRAALTAGAAGGGFLAGVQSFLAAKAPVLAGGGAAAVVAVGIWLAVLKTPSDSSPVSAGPASPAVASVVASTAPAGTGAVPAISGQTAVAATGDQLLLDIVTADTGTPVPNARIEYWLWEGKEVARKTLWADRFGKCAVPVPRGTTTQLILVSQCDGFADTRLDWRPDRGEAIPDRYTLRVARSAPIGGRVVDADGQPVAGAEVGFNNRTDPAKETRPQTDNFDWPFWVTATTDADGRWRIDRIGEATLRTIDGSARHPEHVRSESVSGGDAESMVQLREGRYVFRLGRAVTVRGLVVDTSGQPVPGAKVLVGMRGEVSSRETTAQADGTFEVAGCKPGRSLLSAEAPGFAPTTREVELAADAEPFRLTLAAGRLLRLRVVDSRGFPVPQASVWLNTFRRLHGGSPDEPSPVQVEFNRRTDAEGRVEWDAAPDRELYFDIAASGYMCERGVSIPPDGTEHVVVLQPALTISGTVRDAVSGEPIPRFRIITGWPTPDPATGATNATWSTIDRFWLSFEGGQFRHVFGEPVLGGVADPAYVFKFEAEGYAPLVSRVVRADEGEARLEVRLRPATSTTVTVLLPDGRPAASAGIGLVSPGSRLSLVPGGLSRENLQSGGSLLTTDSQGQFRLPPDDAVTRVIAAHPGGFAETTPAALAADPIIRLQAWGRLEGTYLSRGQPAVDRELLFQYGQGDFRTVSSDFRAYQQKTDRDGRFVFPQVPPGRHRLVRLVPEKAPSGMTSGMAWSHQLLQAVDIRPGETTTATIGGACYSVRARLQWPAGLQREANWRVMGVILTPVPPAPEEARNNPQALKAWRQTPEVAAAFANQRRYPLTETTDGLWLAEDVSAGSYVLHVSAFEPAGAGGQPKQHARAEVPVVVPADPPSGLLDLGQILMEPTP